MLEMTVMHRSFLRKPRASMSGVTLRGAEFMAARRFPLQLPQSIAGFTLP
jgi:hypothetical protein